MLMIIIVEYLLVYKMI